MLRERTRVNASSRPTRPEDTSEDNTAFPIDRVTISNGTIVFFDLQNSREDRIDDLNADVTIGADRQINITGGPATAP